MSTVEEQRLEVVEYSSGNADVEGRYHRFNKLLGKGAYKSVYKAFDSKTQVDVAWNSIELSTMTDNEKNKVFLECEMLQKLNHENILKIRDKWKNEERDELCFVTDIIQNGSLRNYFKVSQLLLCLLPHTEIYLYTQQRKINLKSVKQICRQILLALNYLHEKNVIHRDLKCDNIFIDSNNNHVVLGDLGLSTNFSGQSRMSIVGTPHWMAPELYTEKYGIEVDIWSFGMCALELCTNTIPYKECKNTIQVFQKITKLQKPDSLYQLTDPYIRSFINICLEFNAKLRPTAKELLSHPFLLPRYPKDYVLCDKLISYKQKDENGKNNSTNNQYLKPVKAHTKKRKNSKKKKRKNKTDVNVQTVVSKRDFITTIKLQIYRKTDKPMAVTFDFNIMVDNASDVAQEMISELQLPSVYKSKVENAINDAIKTENEHQTQIVAKSWIKNNEQTTTTTTAQPTTDPTTPPVDKSAVEMEKEIIAKDIELEQNKNNDNNNENIINHEEEEMKVKTAKQDQQINMDICDDLQLIDLKTYLSQTDDYDDDLEIDEKTQEQIVKKREELIKEYNDFSVTKMELLKLRVESITDNQQIKDVIAGMKQSIFEKKKKIEQQYENFISDYIKIAQLTLTSKKKINSAHIFMFEQDAQFQHLIKSELSDDDKYAFSSKLKEARQEIVDQYLAFYTNVINSYHPQVQSN